MNSILCVLGAPVLLKELKDNGYFVWWGGKNDLVPAQLENIFDDYCDVHYQPKPPENDYVPFPSDDKWRGDPDGDNYYSFYYGAIKHGDTPFWCRDEGFVRGAADFIRNYDGDKPLCIYLPIVLPHPCYAVPEEFYDVIDPDKIPDRLPIPENTTKPMMLDAIRERQNMFGWTEDRWKEIRRTYYGMCAYVDHLFGIVVDSMKSANLYDDSAIFFFSDHGDFTGDYGIVEKNQNSFEDFITNVPFLVKPPKDIPVKPRVSDAIVELIDFSETVYELTGIKPDYTRFGKSLLPVIAGKTDDHREAAHCEGGRLRREKHTRECESTSSLNPEGAYWPRVGMQIQDTDHHGKAVMRRTKEYKYVLRIYEADELYDLKKDPGEMVNVIDDPAYKDVRDDMRYKMLAWMYETSDAVPHQTDSR